ncbi:MAG TPA: endo alpha-1,4 polygalactosaminidase [Polyangiaceae bacterium]|nr:endo alpha-1,4 polygalactosaminidase [Polyangiaceae bacterium]
MSRSTLLVLAFTLGACSSAGGKSVFSSGGAAGDAVSAPASGGSSSNSGGQSNGGEGTGGSATSNGGATQAPGGASNGGATTSGSGGTTSTGGASGGAGVAGSSSGGASSTGGANTGGAGGATSGTWWKPAKNTTFYWDLQSTPPDNTRSVGAYDIDGWGNDAQEVSALHMKGIKVVCYMDAGTYEPGRPDSSDFPASLKGNDVQGWPGEVWLDVRPAGPNYAKLQSIMLARFKVCQQKGFDAIEPDNIDSYQNDPGFPTTAADQLAYDEWLATTAHGLGLAILQKNDLDQVRTLEPYFDGVLDEECNQYSECDALAPYPAAGKPAWNAEYTDDGETTSKFCSADASASIVGALFSLALDGSVFQPCPNDLGIIN